MKKLPLENIHVQKLKEYGLQGVPFSACQCLRFAPGETVAREDETISRLAVVVQGRAKVCRTAANGKNLILCWYISEGMIGEVELLTGKRKATTTVTAISDFECVTVDFQYCAAELKTNLMFLNKLGSVLAEKLVGSTDNLASSFLYSGEQRLCSYILRNASRGIFNDMLTDVSCSICVSYRHLSRMLNRLCADGVLQKRKSGFFIQCQNELVRRSCETGDNG